MFALIVTSSCISRRAFWYSPYLAKKRAEGKHYNVALSHAMKKLVRLIYALQKSGKTYLTAA